LVIWLIWSLVFVGIVSLIGGAWYITVVVWAIALVTGLVFKAKQGKKRRQAAEVARQAAETARQAEELARLQRHREEQQRYRNQLIVLAEESIDLFESMPERLDSAEKWLDSAQFHFADGAFAPFWDSIENAAKRLGHFDEGVRQIKDKSSRYIELIKIYEDSPPEFPLAPQSVVKLGLGTATAERMQAIVRKAQRDFHFATIYEQRKTNQILIAGFTTLAQALNDMTWRITDSIDALASSVGRMTSTLDESMRAIHSRMGDIAEAASQQASEHHEEILKAASESAEREKKALEMLDNIQRRRRPFP
jgi:hypothetical protein